MHRHKPKQARALKPGMFLISLALWAQLVFGLGLTLWRYHLVGQGVADVFVTGISERIEDLAEVGGEICPPKSPVVYVYHGHEHAGYTTVRYHIFPRTLTMIGDGSAAAMGELEQIIEDQDAGCLLVFGGAELGDDWEGERVWLNEDDYIVLGPH